MADNRPGGEPTEAPTPRRLRDARNRGQVARSAELTAALGFAGAAAILLWVGDALFAITNVARRLSVDPEAALRGTNRRFFDRFRYIERRLADQDRRPEDATLDEMDALWDEAKRAEQDQSRR